MRIRPAAEADLPRLAMLFTEMERHYGSPVGDDPELVSRRLAAWFKDNVNAVLLVAEDGGEIVGHAALAPLFPAGDVEVAYFVKDIFVSERARGRGVGETLMRASAAEAVKRGAPRLDLTVDAVNSGAASLYARLGATDTDKRYLRWEGEALVGLAGGVGDAQHRSGAGS